MGGALGSRGRSSCWWVVRGSTAQEALQVATSGWELSDGKTNVILGTGRDLSCTPRTENAGNGESLMGLEMEACQAAGSGQVRMSVEYQELGGTVDTWCCVCRYFGGHTFY